MYYNNNGFGEDVKLKIGGPGLPDVPAPGKTMAAQAKAHQYKDLYRDIQAMRDAEFKKEMAKGQWKKEFDGYGGCPPPRDLWKKEFDGYSKGGFGGWLAGLGQAATKKPISTTMLIAAAVAAYFVFFKKKKKKVEAPKKVEKVVEEEIDEVTPEGEIEEVAVEVPAAKETVKETAPVARRKRRW